MAEQDRYGSHLSPQHPTNPIPDQPSVNVGNIPSPKGSGAEQDRFGGWFGGKKDRFGSHFAARPSNPVTAVGLLQSTVLPSFGLHSGLAVIAYGASRAADRAEGKDWLWPSGQVINAWWSAIGTRVVNDGLSLSQAWSTITYPEKLLLGGVSAWGIRLFYHIASRSVARGKDDARYTAAKKDPGFWNKAFFSMFLPEAVVQTLIALPFTLPFRAPVANAQASPLPPYAELFHGLAVFLFSSGFALEVLADAQLDAHREKSSDLNREGVWSVVRHPNYLGDAYVHASFPMLLYSAGILHPLALIGPVANYAFLRFVGGDKENEASQAERYQRENPLKFQQLQEYRREKNSFWPKLQELGNPWHWAVLGAGAAGVALEMGARRLLK
ncbi:DUF1295-domain-containing protein [Saccharata proteae CBS 121410]|uniref:DUF1295-domain-containing protein n=1 Tax=Saccharata proteae CBS 121410 TaxID=1314787 RepID=A0A9P4I1D0_9PEZI|nr:DUF1295-domain-containing protein [Saccharata proteae CBS 121410]